MNSQQIITPIAYGDAQASGNPDLTTVLAKVRDLFPIPRQGDALERAWMEAVACPDSVLQFAALSIDRMKQSLTQGYLLNGEQSHLLKCHNSNKCPVCESKDIESGRLTADDGIAWANVTCNDCESEWYEQYVSSGSLITKKGTVKS